MRAGLGLPPGVHNGCRVLLGSIAWTIIGADDIAEPEPCFGVDGFTHGAQHTQAGEIILIRDLPAPLHAGADQCGRGVELGDFVLLHQLPESALMRGVRCALVDHLGRTVDQRTVDDVAVAGDPSDIGGAPVDVLLRL